MLPVPNSGEACRYSGSSGLVWCCDEGRVARLARLLVLRAACCSGIGAVEGFCACACFPSNLIGGVSLDCRRLDPYGPK